MILEIPTFAFQTAQEPQVLPILVSAQAQVSVSQASVTQLQIPACHLVQFQSQLAHIPSDAIAPVTLNASLTIVILEIPTFAFLTALEAQASPILASAQVLLNVTPSSVTQLLTPACHLAQFLSQLVHIPSDATALATSNASLATVISEIRTIAFPTVLETPTSLILANAQALLNVSQVSVIQLLILAHLLVRSLSKLDPTVLDAIALAMVNALLATAI